MLRVCPVSCIFVSQLVGALLQTNTAAASVVLEEKLFNVNALVFNGTGVWRSALSVLVSESCLSEMRRETLRVG